MKCEKCKENCAKCLNAEKCTKCANGYKILYNKYKDLKITLLQLQNYLKENGIETMIHYPIPPHKQKALSSWNHLAFPTTEKIHDEVLSLPMSSVLLETEITHIITTLNSY